MSNPFKNAQNKYYTRQLFWEQWNDLPNEMKKIEPMFTLYADKPGLINFGKAYVESEDPTGYKISQELLDGYRLWSLLMKSSWFIAAKKMWDEELDARLTSKGLNKMQEILENGGPAQQAVAAKYFADREYRKDKTKSRGRPSKEEVAAEVRKEASFSRTISEDFERIRPKLGAFN
jgi:hypothetical protein